MNLPAMLVMMFSGTGGTETLMDLLGFLGISSTTAGWKATG